MPDWRDEPFGVISPVEWNDWWKFSTTYRLTLVLGPRESVEPGQLKLAHSNMGFGGQDEDGTYTAPRLPAQFIALSGTYFSLGQSESYYETIAELPGDLGAQVFRALRDCAFDLSTFSRFISEPVMGDSLLRYVERSTVRGRFHRLATGNAELTEYNFAHPVRPEDLEVPEVNLTFEVKPHSNPPTNMHALIGRNGVGKTRFFLHLVEDVLRQDRETREFRSLVSISLSAFDDARPIVPDEASTRFTSVSIREFSDGTSQLSQLKDKAELAQEFVESLTRCRGNARQRRWIEAVGMLSTDPLFAESRISDFGIARERNWQANAERIFKKMSSGHAAVLLSITRLVELLEERTLVLIDEPESHLHPPLLSSFIRTVSALLVQRNGVALVATHSPVVLQEVPASCVWILQRTGLISRADRPTIETFGENVGVLTSEVFGLEVSSAGFHALLRAHVGRGGDYASLVARFDGQLGSEAKAILRGLLASSSHD